MSKVYSKHLEGVPPKYCYNIEFADSKMVCWCAICALCTMLIKLIICSVGLNLSVVQLGKIINIACIKI